MTVQQLSSNISDDSDEMVSLPSAEEIYRRKFQLLLDRCEVLQQDNERIVNRIQEVKKITKRYKKDVNLLMERLDRHGDPYRNVVMDAEVKTEAPAAPRPSKTPASSKHTDKNAPTSGKKPAKRKPKSEKPERDPNAPKKPCNAFFQFCQEQRPLVIAETLGVEPSKQEVTRQLASRWRALSSEDKKVYVAMFERSKEKYAVEMSAYIKKEQ